MTQTARTGWLGAAEKYAFRFTGFALGPDKRPYNIVGQGHMTLTPDGTLSGRQTSTIIPLVGEPLTLTHSVYFLSGTYEFYDDGTGVSTVFFHPGSAAAEPDLMDVFNIIRAGPDRFWSISTGPRQLPSQMAVPELVSAESVRIL